VDGTPDESDEEDIVQENDGDWDDDTTAAASNFDDIDLEKFGLAPRFFPPTLPGADVTDSTNEYPDLDLNHEEIMKKVAEANEKWARVLQDEKEETPSIKKQNDPKVKFSEPLVTQVLTEDPEMAEELRSARIRDFDRGRMRTD